MSPALNILLRLNCACNSQEEEGEEDKAEREENNIKVKYRYESRCMSREALMTALLCLTPPCVQLLCFIDSAVPSPASTQGNSHL